MLFSDEASFLKDLKRNAHSVDQSPEVLSKYLNAAISIAIKNQLNPAGLIENEFAYQVFTASTALGFTLLQHLVSHERLLHCREWQNANQETWEKIKSGTLLVGLGTTHLGRPGGPSLIGRESNEDFLIEGQIPWCTGSHVFEKLVIAFKTPNEIVFALIDYPKNDQDHQNVKTSLIDLQVLNGTATASIQFTNYQVETDQILSKRTLGIMPTPTESLYRMPELGMAEGLLNYCQEVIDANFSPKNQMIRTEMSSLEKELIQLNLIRKDPSAEIEIEHFIKKDALLKNLGRLLVIISGARSLEQNSKAIRLNLETFLMDVVIQPKELIEQKVKSICK